MKGMEQDEEDSSKDAFIPIAKALASEQLLGHKDKGVKAYTACCAVDVLRLCAPTAPFTQKELKVCSERASAILFEAPHRLPPSLYLGTALTLQRLSLR
jgi:hypothetical protein